MSLDLARERINLLDLKKLDNGLYAVMYEFQYSNKDGSKIWQKDIMLCAIDDIMHGEVGSAVLQEVYRMRAELER